MRRRRRFQRGHLSKRKHGRRLVWLAQWRENGRGRSKVLGRCADLTEAQACSMLAAILQPINAGLLGPAPGAWSFGQFIESTYLPACRRKWKPSTLTTTEDTIRTHLLAEMAARPLRSITRQELQDLLDRKAQAGLAASTVAKIRWQLAAVFRMAMGDGVISVNPTLATFRREIDGVNPLVS